MRRIVAPLACFVALLGVRISHAEGPSPATSVATAPVAVPPAGPSLHIANETEVLGNGLTVIYHRDSAVPTVVVNVSYQVGSRMEVAKRTGFAHLFEHLMFMGTARAPTKMFDAWMEGAGGWNNAWTSEDRTDYYDVAPKGALPLLLWLEADRMRNVGPLMTQEKLNAQRDVVRNERRQSYENRPYGLADLKLSELLFPSGHPYFHTPIGSHEDLEAAQVDDVKAFFAKWYVPRNASLVVAGDFDLEATKALVLRYFGGIVGGQKPVDPNAEAAYKMAINGPSDWTMQDDVELARVTLAWRSPDHFAAGDAEADLLASLLGDGQTSRLYKTLVTEKRIAQSVSVHQASAARGSHFEIEVMVRKGSSNDAVVAAVEKELAAIRKTAPTDSELARARAKYKTAFLQRLESLRERASVLNAYQAEVGTPDYAEKDLMRYMQATPEAVRKTADILFGTPRVKLIVTPKSADEPKSAAPKGGK